MGKKYVGSALTPRIRILGGLAIATFLMYFIFPWETVDHRETVLVTGGLGFIGSTLVEELQEEGYNVIIFDDESTGHNINPIADKIRGDITVIDDIALIQDKVDYVIHYAAAISVAESVANPAKYEKINVAGSRNIFRWAAMNRVKRVVAASSAAVYGIPTSLPLSENADKNPISPYATSKLEMEHLMELYHSLYNKTDYIALRFFNVYGPRQNPKSAYSGVVSKFLERAHSGNPIIINGDGTNTRDFVFVKDIAKATIAAMQRGSGFEVYNVGTESRITMEELAKTIIEITGSQSTIEFAEPREGDIAHSFSNTTKIREQLKWSPSVSLKEGLLRTYNWFKSENEDQVV